MKPVKRILKYLLLLSIPVLLFLMMGYIVIPSRQDFVRESCNFILTSTLIYSFSWLFPSSKTRKIASFCGYILLSILLLIKLSFYYTYQTKLSASALFVIFETNTQEASSFLDIYVNRFFIIVGLFILFFWFVAWRQLFVKGYSPYS